MKILQCRSVSIDNRNNYFTIIVNLLIAAIVSNHNMYLLVSFHCTYEPFDILYIRTIHSIYLNTFVDSKKVSVFIAVSKLFMLVKTKSKLYCNLPFLLF